MAHKDQAGKDGGRRSPHRRKKVTSQRRWQSLCNSGVRWVERKGAEEILGIIGRHGRQQSLSFMRASRRPGSFRAKSGQAPSCRFVLRHHCCDLDRRCARRLAIHVECRPIEFDRGHSRRLRLLFFKAPPRGSARGFGPSLEELACWCLRNETPLSFPGGKGPQPWPHMPFPAGKCSKPRTLSAPRPSLGHPKRHDVHPSPRSPTRERRRHSYQG